MDYAWVCVEIAGDAPLPEKVKIKAGNLKEQSDCQFTEIYFHYQWKPNQHKLPAQKGPEVIRKHPFGVYRHKRKNRVDPKPTSSGPSIGSKGPIQGKLQLFNSPPFSNSFGALQDVENEGPFVEKEIGREGSCVGVALGSDKEDQSPLTKNGAVIHTTMVMEPSGDKFTLNDCPALVSDVSDGVNGNLISSSSQNAQWNTSSIQDRLSATSTWQIRASSSPIEGEISECPQSAEDPDLTKVDRDPTHSPVQPL
ncbi:hypothetical protein Nepgr_027264 [Nepenthes gracilis]|uniref:Uncharacterized protein n=1 Tax=Nepenthes gracilis TaxID=150966 RepID=A0AAD3TA79_NEPGR|nr:hypothetical protein Nepgr_027264 [Nepenthes gracilis]